MEDELFGNLEVDNTESSERLSEKQDILSIFQNLSDQELELLLRILSRKSARTSSKDGRKDELYQASSKPSQRSSERTRYSRKSGERSEEKELSQFGQFASNYDKLLNSKESSSEFPMRSIPLRPPPPPTAYAAPPTTSYAARPNNQYRAPRPARRRPTQTRRPSTSYRRPSLVSILYLKLINSIKTHDS